MVPETFAVLFTTTRGQFTVEARTAWAPLGAARFHELVETGFYNDVAFFRVLPGFVAQFGINGDPARSAQWHEKVIQDDPVVGSNTTGTISFAMAGPNTRTTQLFVNLADNARLDGMGFAPFAEVTDGMSVVQSLCSEYGEGAPRGRGPDQGLIQSEGNAYLREQFPNLDYITEASVTS